MTEILENYRRMMRIRRFEEAVFRLGTEGVVAGATHLCGGQEAVPVGVHSALIEDDRVTATYRGHGWALESGAPMKKIMAEICHRESGTNGGRAGSAMISAPEFGFVGQNAIVGAGVSISAGVAMAQRNRDLGGVSVVSIGDGAMNQGGTHEGLVWAAGFDLPLLVVCENNGWAEMTPGDKFLRGESFAARAAALGYRTEKVDGLDPDAVEAAARRLLEHVRSGGGPAFLECMTSRLMAHYNGDIEHYRVSEEISAERRDSDPVLRYRERAIARGISADELDAVDAKVEREVDEAARAAADSPEPDASSARMHVIGAEQSLTAEEETQDRTLTYAAAVNEALRSELGSRPEALVFGEDVGVAGGVFGLTRRLQREFGERRVFDTPISETGILGSGLGLALSGYRPIVEIMWSDFMLVALDQLINQAANIRYLSRGKVTAPLVVRTQQGITPGSCSQHVQSLEAILAHVPGLKVGLPSTPQDAYSMLRAAVADEDPCIIFESRSLYGDRSPVITGGPIEGARGAHRRRDGSDVGIITWGSLAPAALQAAESLDERGISAAVLDLRWLSPLDDEAIDAIVRDCGGRIVIAHEANITGGFGAEIAARIAERHGPSARVVQRVGLDDTRVPASPALQAMLLPDHNTIMEAAATVAQR